MSVNGILYIIHCKLRFISSTKPEQAVQYKYILGKANRTVHQMNRY